MIPNANVRHLRCGGRVSTAPADRLFVSIHALKVTLTVTLSSSSENDCGGFHGRSFRVEASSPSDSVGGGAGGGAPVPSPPPGRLMVASDPLFHPGTTPSPLVAPGGAHDDPAGLLWCFGLAGTQPGPSGWEAGSAPPPKQQPRQPDTPRDKSGEATMGSNPREQNPGRLKFKR